MGTGRLRLGLCFVALTTALATVACGPGNTTASPPVPVITNLPTPSTSEASPFPPPDTVTETVVLPSTTTTVPPAPHPSTPRRTVVAPHPSTHPRTVVPPPGPVDGPVPAAQIDESGAAADPPRDVRTERGGTAVVFTVEESGCDQIHPEVTGQSASRVLIMLVRTEPTKHAICPMFARNALLTASLSKPLGQRRLVFEAITESP